MTWLSVGREFGIRKQIRCEIGCKGNGESFRQWKRNHDLLLTRARSPTTPIPSHTAFRSLASMLKTARAIASGTVSSPVRAPVADKRGSQRRWRTEPKLISFSIGADASPVSVGGLGKVKMTETTSAAAAAAALAAAVVAAARAAACCFLVLCDGALGAVSPTSLMSAKRQSYLLLGNVKATFVFSGLRCCCTENGT